MAGKQWQEGRIERKSVIMHESGPISCHGAGETEAGRAGEKEDALAPDKRSATQPAKGTKERLRGGKDQGCLG